MMSGNYVFLNIKKLTLDLKSYSLLQKLYKYFVVLTVFKLHYMLFSLRLEPDVNKPEWYNTEACKVQS